MSNRRRSARTERRNATPQGSANGVEVSTKFLHLLGPSMRDDHAGVFVTKWLVPGPQMNRVHVEGTRVQIGLDLPSPDVGRREGQLADMVALGVLHERHRKGCSGLEHVEEVIQRRDKFVVPARYGLGDKEHRADVPAVLDG